MAMLSGDRVAQRRSRPVLLPWDVKMPGWGQVLCTLLLAVVIFVSLYPMLQVLIQSFQLNRPGEAAQFGLNGWRAVLSDTSIQSAVWNTITVGVVRQAIALAIALVIAWLLARTDVPGRHVFEFLFWVAFFFPALTVTLAWIFLLDPQYGIVNQLLDTLGLAALGIGPFNIYSFWGIVWVHLVGSSVAVKVMLLTPAFRNMNSSYEEASRVSGASTFSTVTKILFPLMLPTIVAVELLSLLRSFEAFEIERVLGSPIRFFVVSTWIYDQLAQIQPRFDSISAIAVVMIVVGLLLVALQRAIIGTRRYSTVTGQFQGNVVRLGRLRWVAFGLLVLAVVLVVAVPIFAALAATLMKKFGFFTADSWTLRNWEVILNDRILINALKNTAVLAISTMVGSLVVFSLIAYVITRTKFWGRTALDYASWLPFTVPGIILSLALVTMFLQPVFRPLYGSMFTLVLALMVAGMPLAVQTMKGAFLQLSHDLEEASLITGGTWWHTYRNIVLPIISPTLMVVGLISFISAGRNISQVALLSNSTTRPLSVMQLDYISEGRYETAAVIAIILLLLSLGMALIARRFGYRGLS
jgi:iron(III) transport system permease protein